jgi:hypothetical protein
VTAYIESALGRRVFVNARTPDTEHADVQLMVQVYDESVRAELELRDAASGAALGRRVLVAPSCSELGEALGLALSLMLDFSVRDIPELQLRAAGGQEPANATGETDAQVRTKKQESQPEPDPTKPALAARPEPAVPVGSQLPGESHPGARGGDLQTRAAFDFRLGGAWTLGNSPGAGVGVTGAGGLRLAERWYFAAGVTHYFPSSRSTLGGRVTTSHTDLLALFCPFRWGSEFELRACARLGAGWLRAGAEGFDQTDTAQGWVAAAGLEALGVYPVQPLVLWVEVAADAALNRASLTVMEQDASREAYTMSAIWGSLLGGVGVVFD